MICLENLLRCSGKSARKRSSFSLLILRTSSSGESVSVRFRKSFLACATPDTGHSTSPRSRAPGPCGATLHAPGPGPGEKVDLLMNNPRTSRYTPLCLQECCSRSNMQHLQQALRSHGKGYCPIHSPKPRSYGKNIRHRSALPNELDYP